MKSRPYPEYKDSGVEWIGEIPNGWEVRKIKHLTQNMDGKRVPISAENRIEGEIPYYGATGIVDYVKDYIFDEELLLIGEDGAPFFDSYKDVAFMISGKTWVNNHAHVLRVDKKFNIKLIMHILNQADYSLYIKGSTRDKLNQDQLKEIPVLVPLGQEKNSIVSFLDKKTSEIDKTIENYTRLIELLQEKRTSLINHVVTKGLDPEAPMTDSGIEWIGEIPEGWEVNKIKNMASVRISNVDKKSKPDEPDVLLCNYTDVYNNDFITSDIDFMKATANFEQIKKLSLLKDDVIITKDSESPDDIAVPTLVNEHLDNVVCGYHLALIRPNNAFLDGNFLFRSLESKKINDQFVVNANGVTRFGISTYPIKNSYLIIPSLKEQIKIVNYLENQISNIDKTIIKINENIRLLQEYKKSLIHHVVTGKVNVIKDD